MWPLLLAGLNVGMGAVKAEQAAKQRQQEAALRAAEVEASPWTGKGPTTQLTTGRLNPWAEMAGGAVNTLGQMAALQNAGLLKKSSEDGLLAETEKTDDWKKLANLASLSQRQYPIPY